MISDLNSNFQIRFFSPFSNINNFKLIKDINFEIAHHVLDQVSLHFFLFTYLLCFLIIRSDYDRGVNTFSPEGRLLQVEYAIEAIKLGSSAIGIKVKEGVVLAVERRVASTLMEPKSIEKIYEVSL